jgi:hypothetical protein
MINAANMRVEVAGRDNEGGIRKDSQKREKFTQ